MAPFSLVHSLRWPLCQTSLERVPYADSARLNRVLSTSPFNFSKTTHADGLCLPPWKPRGTTEAIFLRQRPGHCTERGLEGPSPCGHAVCLVPFSATYSLFFITPDDQTTKSRTAPSLKTSAHPCSHLPSTPFFSARCFTHLSKKQLKYRLFKKPSNISLNRVSYTFYIYGVSYYAEMYTFQNLLLDYTRLCSPNACAPGTEV